MKRQRLLKDLTLDDVFLRTGISIPKLSRIERGIFKPNERERKLIAKVLKAKPEEIFPESWLWSST